MGHIRAAAPAALAASVAKRWPRHLVFQGEVSRRCWGRASEDWTVSRDLVFSFPIVACSSLRLILTLGSVDGEVSHGLYSVYQLN